MKRLIATVTALGLIALAPAAVAQDEHKQGDQHPSQGARPGGPPGAAAHAPPGGPGGGHKGGANERAPDRARGRAPGAPAAGPHNGAPRNGAPHNAPPQNATMARPQNQGVPGRGEGAAGRTPDRGERAGPAAHSNPQANGRAGARPGRQAPNVAALRGAVQATRRFRVGAYHPPRGYVSRRWNFGDRLPHTYFARNYWLTDFLAYGLLAPPPGLIWVRVGPDALLIDEYSGEIVRVEYDVFY